MFFNTNFYLRSVDFRSMLVDRWENNLPSFIYFFFSLFYFPAEGSSVTQLNWVICRGGVILKKKKHTLIKPIIYLLLQY